MQGVVHHAEPLAAGQLLSRLADHLDHSYDVPFAALEIGRSSPLAAEIQGLVGIAYVGLQLARPRLGPVVARRRLDRVVEQDPPLGGSQQPGLAGLQDPVGGFDGHAGVQKVDVLP